MKTDPLDFRDDFLIPPSDRGLMGVEVMFWSETLRFGSKP